MITSICLCCSAQYWSFPERQLYFSQVTLLAEHSLDFSVINWVSRNPNLNPTEHLWDVFEQAVKGHHTVPQFNICQVIPMEHFQKHFESMPHHVAAVINARESPIRY